jgi:hypothetical protein
MDPLRGEWPPPAWGEWVDLGDGNWLTKPASFTDEGGNHLGSWWAHTRPDGTNDGLGRIVYDSDHHGLASEDPITIDGSLLCIGCGRHGFVREGRWVEA